MTRNANNSMRKMVVTGLGLIGMVLGGLATVGCDQVIPSQLSTGASWSDAARADEPDAGTPYEKSRLVQGVIRGGPPRR